MCWRIRYMYLGMEHTSALRWNSRLLANSLLVNSCTISGPRHDVMRNPSAPTYQRDQKKLAVALLP